MYATILLEHGPRSAHIKRMATRTESASSRNDKSGRVVLGRSAATGRFVLKPASKSGSVTQKAAKSAVAKVSERKKK